ncbi:MAG TPA: hypothetical protein PKC69_11945 [Chitinophagaceae bacterium]|nr:hypothetical protein [Chitinophagaceae bacterium]
MDLILKLNKNIRRESLVMRSLFFLLFIILGLSCYSQHPVHGVSLDGSYSFREMTDTAYFKQGPVQGPYVSIREGKDYYYIYVHSSSIVNLAFLRTDTLYLLHVSGSVGMSKWAVSDSLHKAKLIQGLRPVMNFPADWDFVGPFVAERFLNQKKNKSKVQEELIHCLNRKGYTATTFDMGSRNEFELLIRRDLLENALIMIAYSDHDWSPRKFPSLASLCTDSAAEEKVLSADFEEITNIILQTANWYRLPAG